MNLQLCKLTFKSPLHLGERENIREGTEIFIHSDTLFSAFCHNYLLLYGKPKLELILEKILNRDPPFLITSSFPWWNNSLYFPIPKNQIPKDKKAKKILFIEKIGFGRLLSGEKIENLVAEKVKTIPTEEGNNPWEVTNAPRIGLSRLTNQPGDRYFHFGEVFYKENSGLFFLIEFKDKNFEKEFVATFNLMADEGIGGDRSSGRGLFKKPEFGALEINLPENDSIVSLSLYHPTDDELFDITNSYYELIERKGYIYSPHSQSLRRKSVRMFSEGSVFASKKKGDIADVTPELFEGHHRVFRYGLCFALPCKVEVDG